MKLSLLEILEATGGGEVGGTQVGNVYSTFHTDSREVLQGGVFFALRGAEMDGHRFVDDAIRRAVAKAGETVRHLDWFEVGEIRGHIEHGAIAHRQVTL